MSNDKDKSVAAVREVGERLQVPFDLAMIRKAPGFEVPDIEGTVEGWRAWTVAKQPPRFGTTPKLQSAAARYTWYPQQTAEAECPKDHTPADARCTCGFYSAKTLKHLMQLGYASTSDYDEGKSTKVIGRVANWGQVTEATSGWRSQYSYPVMLFVLPSDVRLIPYLAKAFGCKVRMLNWLKPPGDLDQVAAVSGKVDFERLHARPKQQGRRCRHVSLPLQGFLGGEPVQKSDGAWWVEVRWDVRMDERRWMKVSNLVISKREDHHA